MLLKGKVSLITGAGHGIGRGIALRFAAEGATIGVLDKDKAACLAVVAEIQHQGGQAVSLPADVSQADEVHTAVHHLVELLGAPDILVHNAAVMPGGTIDATSEADWDRAFAVNVKGAYLTCREIVPLMRQKGKGSIILMSSITGVNGLPELAAYSATKGALISLARAMAIDHAREGIRVNSVAPGTIDSSMLHQFVSEQKDPEATRRAFDEVYPMGRVGTIEEVVPIFVFLASDQSSFVTGANYVVDGGMSIKSEQPRI